MQCPICEGTGGIPTPDGKAFQECWRCGGTGVDTGVEVFFLYLWDRTLTASEIRRQERITIDGDAPFLVKALSSTQQSTWRIRIQSAPSKLISSAGTSGTNDFVDNGNISGSAEFPYPFIPHIEIARAGALVFDIENLVAANNRVQLCFHGAKRYPTPR